MCLTDGVQEQIQRFPRRRRHHAGRDGQTRSRDRIAASLSVTYLTRLRLAAHVCHIELTGYHVITSHDIDRANKITEVCVVCDVCHGL